MRQYERSGIHVDQCTECRGIFLDRGELEGLVDAELRWAQTAAPAQAAPAQAAPAQAAPAPVPAAPAQHGYQQPYPPQQQYGKPKKKRSFLEDLFD
jgi:hypothetical protein